MPEGPGLWMLLLVAPVGWAFGSVWSRGRDLPSPFMAAAGQMLCGSVMLIVVGLLRGSFVFIADLVRDLPEGLDTRTGERGLALSAVKRSLGAKDWGEMIEGHGGALDRLDSVVFAAPVFFHVVRYNFQ